MGKNLLPLLIGGVAIVLLVSSFKAKNGNNVDSYIDLSPLSDRYGADSVNALNRLQAGLIYATDPNTGDPLNPKQRQLLLAQALLETGLFTDNPNWNNINHNNFAGIKAHGSYAAIPGSSLGYANYNTIDDFVSDWLRILSNNYQPLEAESQWAFVHQLKENGYFESNENAYLDNLNTYYTMLSDL